MRCFALLGSSWLQCSFYAPILSLKQLEEEEIFTLPMTLSNFVFATGILKDAVSLTGRHAAKRYSSDVSSLVLSRVVC